ncbi:MAG: PHP domain-containing protein, partial [Betaproteobacteria bacterium]|nr:PHP domain-containing protein [Betaproteobacteria bacterium]
MTAFAELHCLSNFTFLRGASHAGELVERAAKLGYRALAITDECSLAGIVRAHEAAKEHGLHLIVGIEIHLEDGPSLVLLAMNREGYGNLSALVTTARRRTGKGSYRLTRRDLDDGVPACMALWIRSFRPRMPAAGEGKTERTVTGDSHRLAAMAGPPPASPACEPSSHLLDTARWLRARFGDRLWLAAELHQGPDDAAHLTHLRALSAAAAIPVVAANDVHMHARQRRALQDVMTAIRLGTPVATAGTALHPNAERHLRPLET